MRKFEGDKIWVDGGPMKNKVLGEAYEREILILHDKIAGAPFGRSALDIVSKVNNLVGILHGKRGDTPGAQALAGVKNYARDFQFTARDGTSQVGTGEGGAAVVILDPKGDLGGMPADVTLVHELVHAWREGNGRWKPTSMLDLVSSDIKDPMERAKYAKRFENWEEFFALVVEGVYASQQGATTARTAQNGPFAGFFFATKGSITAWEDVPLTDSQRFAELYKPAIIRIMSEERDMYKAMLGANAWFNPVRDLAQLSTYKASLPPPRAAPPPGMFDGADRFNLNDFY